MSLPARWDQFGDFAGWVGADAVKYISEILNEPNKLLLLHCPFQRRYRSPCRRQLGHIHCSRPRRLKTHQSIVNGCAGLLPTLLPYSNPVVLTTAGEVDGALQFDGIDDYANAGFVLDPADSVFCVFTWVKGGADVVVVAEQQENAPETDAG